MKKNPLKTLKRKKASTPAEGSKTLSLSFSVFLLLLLCGWLWDPSARVLRVFLNGDGTERLKCDFNIGGAQTSWAYAGSDGVNPKTVRRWGLSYLAPSTEVAQLPLLNHNMAGGPLMINNRAFAEGIGSHAPSKIAFKLEKKYAQFSCKVGLDKISGYNHGVIFSLIADGREIYKSPKLLSDSDPFPVDCSLDGVKELILFADNIQVDETVSNVDWVDLKFEPKSENN